MAENLENYYNFRYVWLNSGEIVHLQSRGLSLEVVGYLPISIRNKDGNDLKELFENNDNKLLDFGNLLVNNRRMKGESADKAELDKYTFIMPGVKYVSSGIYLEKANPTDYDKRLINFHDNLWTNIRATAATEMKFSAYADDPRVKGEDIDIPDPMNITPGGTIQISFDIKQEDFSNKLYNGDFFIDAIMLFGQAYNRRGKDQTAQGNLQKVVPIGLVLYENDRQQPGDSSYKHRPFIKPSKLDGVVIRETLNIGLLQGQFNVSPITDTEAFSAWSGFQGSLHLVNDGFTTSGTYFLNDHHISSYGESQASAYSALSGQGTYAFREKLYMGENSLDDRNFDFATPASLTIMRDDEPGVKNPQTLLGRVGWDEEGKFNYWDGVATTYWNAATRKGTSGAVYSMDWISQSRPGFNIFCDDTVNEHPNVPYFGGGFNLLTTSSYAAKFGGNLFGKNNLIWGNATTYNSNNITFEDGYRASAFNAKSSTNNLSYGSVFINSRYIDVSARGSKTTDHVSTLGSENIHIVEWGGKNNTDTRRVYAIGSQQYNIWDSDKVLLLNVKGTKTGTSWTNGVVRGSNNVTVIGGRANVLDSVKAISIGGENHIAGTDSNRIREAIVIGHNNTITTKTTKWGDQQDLITIGYGLQNDPRQQIFERSTSPSKTLILGEYNNVYTQLSTVANLSTKGNTKGARKGKKGGNSINYNDYDNPAIYPTAIKQIVVGGYKPVNTRNGIKKYNSFELGVDNEVTNESFITLADVKGRAVDYSSRGVNVAVMEELTQEKFDKYDYHYLGNINWAKLVNLLWRLSYNPSTGVVTYQKGKGNFNDPENRAQYMDMVPGNTGIGYDSRCFFDLVRGDIGIGPLP